MSNQKKNACVIYVASTKSELPRVQVELERNGYVVCTVLAAVDTVRKLRSDEGDVPEAIRRCIESSDLCVFLVPEDEVEDGGLHGAAGLASQLGKRIVGLVNGGRIVYPEAFEVAGAIIRMSSARLASVIQGEDTWEAADSSIIKDRPIRHQRCQ